MELVGKLGRKIFSAVFIVVLLQRLSLVSRLQWGARQAPRYRGSSYPSSFPPASGAASLLPLFIFLSLPFLLLSYLSAHPPLVWSIYFWYLQQEKDGDRLEKGWQRRVKQIKGREDLIYEERLKALNLHSLSRQHLKEDTCRGTSVTQTRRWL